MLFHLGALWRLYDTGLLRSIDRISSVSGGSITAGVLAMNWGRLSLDPAHLQEDFVPQVVAPIRALAGRTMDLGAIFKGLLFPGKVSDRAARYYNAHLFKGATLQDLPDKPRFVINALNVQSGALWRFMKPYMRDYRVGEVKSPTVPLAVAVAASAAFPPLLSPIVLKLSEKDFTANSGQDLQREPFTKKVVLTDGGVYDNMGLETAWKRYQTILVSDAGAKLEPQGKPKGDWIRHTYRVLTTIDDQVRSLRKRQLIQSYLSDERKGAYWSIRSDIADFHLADALLCPHERTLALANTKTRLKGLDDGLQEKLINWGYAVCDAALRKHVKSQIKRPSDFPYPSAGV